MIHSWLDLAGNRMSEEGLAGDALSSALQIARGLDLGFAPLRCGFVPGRIELVGKHTDYAGGRSITCAVTHGFVVAVYENDGGTLKIEDPIVGTTLELGLDGRLIGPDAGWSVYPKTILSWLKGHGLMPKKGMHIRFSSNLAPAAGLSSSSAFSVALLWAILERSADLAVKIPDRRAFAALAGAVEMGAEYEGFSAMEGVGTRGGTQDHLAILCSRRGQWRQYSYAHNQPEDSWPMPDGFCFVIGVSGVEAVKTGAALDSYNRASDSAKALAQLWTQETGRPVDRLSDVYEIGAGAVERLAGMVTERRIGEWSMVLLSKRLAHYRREVEEVVPGVGKALAERDVQALGEIVDHSMQGATRLLGNQVPETVHLAEHARRLGAAAASAFGAGFGGAVWAMVEEQAAASFREEWERDYMAAFPARSASSRFLVDRAGPAAFSLDERPFWP